MFKVLIGVDTYFNCLYIISLLLMLFFYFVIFEWDWLWAFIFEFYGLSRLYDIYTVHSFDFWIMSKNIKSWTILPMQTELAAYMP